MKELTGGAWLENDKYLFMDDGDGMLVLCLAEWSTLPVYIKYLYNGTRLDNIFDELVDELIESMKHIGNMCD